MRASSLSARLSEQPKSNLNAALDYMAKETAEGL